MKNLRLKGVWLHLSRGTGNAPDVVQYLKDIDGNNIPDINGNPIPVIT